MPMSYLISIIVFLLLFSLLILVHEFGHFYAARRAGVKVEEFGLGLPPRAKGLYKDKKGTLYSLNWIPFGGFVRMYGEDSTDEGMRSKEGSFASKGIIPRIIIILGGVIMNFLMGFVILTYLFNVGVEPFIVNQADFDYYKEQGYFELEERVTVTGFVEESPAIEAGLLQGDRLQTANGTDLNLNQDLVTVAQENASGSIVVDVLRDDEVLSIEIPVNESGQMGVMISDAPLILSQKKMQLDFLPAVKQAGYETARLSVETMKMFVEVLFNLFTKAELSDQVSGPVGIAQLTHNATQQGGLIEILKLIALLSISLGAINVLPIPALDGGRFLSIIFEILTGKRPNAAWEARIHATGFIIILILIFAVTYNDILKLLG
jgi:regulator of sigma E protease